MLKLAGLHTES